MNLFRRMVSVDFPDVTGADFGGRPDCEGLPVERGL